MPDRAAVHLVIEAEGASRDIAYGEASQLVSAVDEVLVAYGDFIDGGATASLVVHPKTRSKRGENVRTGWRAARTSRLDVTDVTRLGDLIAELSAAGGAVAGPYWQLNRDNAAHREARRLAAADARRRAEDYATALALEVERVLWVAEPGLRSGSDLHIDRPHAAIQASAAGPTGDEVIDVTPDEVSVHAAVDVGFSVKS